MDVTELLSLFSELAIGFLAFTALITVLGDARSETTSIREVANGSVTVPIIFLLASALPFAYLTYAPITSSGWQVATGLLLIIWIVDYGRSVSRGVRNRPELKGRAAVEITVVTLLCFLPLGANVLGLFPDPQDGYVLALCILLLTTCVNFARVVGLVLRTRFDESS